MAEPPFRNRELIRALFDRYYVRACEGLEPYVSSHWQKYSERFNVALDGDGNVVSLLGAGFGEMLTTSLTARALAGACNLSYLLALRNRMELLRLRSHARRVARSMGFYFSFDCFRQMCSLAVILRHLGEKMKQGSPRFPMIGDGYGFLSSVVKEVLPGASVVMVDIGKTLLFQAVYCQKAHPRCTHAGVFEEAAAAPADFLYCPAEELDRLGSLRFDVAVNIASMQEMNVATIDRYFAFLRERLGQDNLFYCCNRERKVLPGGETLEFMRYPWRAGDRHLVDEPCPWYKYFLSFGHTERGPSLLGARLPLVKYFDGPVRHRLSVLSVSGDDG